MRKLLLALALFLWPSIAWADCTGVFPTNTICGNLSANPQPPAPFTASTVVGPGSSVVNELAVWANVGGSQLKDATGISAVPNGLFSVLGPSSALISTANTPNEVLIQSGSTGTPITAGNTPTVQISRIESIVNGTSTGDGSLGAALRVDASTNNTQQLNAFKVTATNLTGATNDVVGAYSGVTQGGTANLGIHAYAGYFVADATTAGNYAVAIGTGVFNNTGASQAYSAASCCGTTAFDAVAQTSAGSSTYMGSAMVVRVGTNALWDVGFAIQTGAIRTAEIWSDSSATNLYYVHAGTHSYGLNWGAATFTTEAISTPGFTVNPVGVVGATAVNFATYVSGLACPGIWTASNIFSMCGASGGYNWNNNAANAVIMTLSNAGTLVAAGAVVATSGFQVGAGPTAGVNCSGSPTSSFAASLGIVTHC